jgi:hypothetical protein
MALDNGFLQSKAGVALMRYDFTAGDWTFVSWITKGQIIDTVIPGRSYAYHIWAIVGYYATASSLTASGETKLVAVQLAK